MAITKRFTQLHAALVTSDAPTKALEAGILAACQVYSNQDAEMALLLINDTPQYMRKQFASWFRSYGVLVVEPKYGEKMYSIGAGLVKDPKRQTKIIGELKSIGVRPVLTEDITARAAAKVKKPLEGTPQARAAKKVASLIKSLRKDDADAAAYLNDTWSANSEVTTMAFEDGQEFDLTASEMGLVLNYVKSLRRSSTMLKAA